MPGKCTATLDSLTGGEGGRVPAPSSCLSVKRKTQAGCAEVFPRGKAAIRVMCETTTSNFRVRIRE